LLSQVADTLVHNRSLELTEQLGKFDHGRFEFGEDRVPTPAKQRERAASLYLVASDAFGRGEPEFAEILIQKANQYADQAAGLQSCGGSQRQQNE
jgi:hypothetical protein